MRRIKFDRWKISLISILIFSVLVFAYIQAIPNPGHGGDRIFIAVNGNDTDLQSAIDSGEFSVDYFGGVGYSGDVVFGHTGENIFVRVNDTDKIL